MSVVKTVGQGVTWNAVAVGLGKAVIFVNVFIILRFLSVYEYGFSELVMSVVSIVGVFLLPGLTSTIIADLSLEYGRKNFAQTKTIFLQYATLNLILGIASWALLFFGSHPVAEWAGNPYASQFIQIASFLFLISPLRQMSVVLASVMLRFFDVSFYGIFEEICKCILLIVCVVWLRLGLHGLMYAIVLSQAIVLLCYVPRTISAYIRFSHAPTSRATHFWNMVRDHRKWSVGSSYVNSVGQNLRIWVIKLMLGTEAVGMFAYAYGIYSHIASLLPIATVLGPIIPRYVDKREQLLRIVRASVKVQLATGLGFAVIAWVTGYAFTAFFFPKYVAAVPLLYVMVLGIISNSVATLFNPVFTAFKEQQSLLVSNVLKFFYIAFLLPVSIFLFGTIGIAIEVVATTYLNGIERYVRLRSLLPGLSLRPAVLFSADAYEREATRTVLTSVVSRLPRPIRSLVLRQSDP